MYVRLAFAVAAHLDPDILVVDEVLAVGDLAFQRKCLGRMKEVSGSGRTVLFVSHNMAAIASLCDRGLLIENGSLRFVGPTSRCIDEYVSRHRVGSDWRRGPEEGREKVWIEGVSCRLEGDQPRLELLVDVDVGSVHDSAGAALFQAIPTSEGFVGESEGTTRIRARIQLPPLIPGHYSVSVWVGPHNTETFDWSQHVVAFDVVASPIPGRSFPHHRDHGFMVTSSSLEVAGEGEGAVEEVRR